jgi:hypothetical protein
MKTILKNILGYSVLTAGVVGAGLCGLIQPANALVLHDGWNYSMDVYNDSTGFNRDGNGAFEIYGSAYKVVGDKAYFAINSNVNLSTGVYSSVAADQRIDFGDMLLNFTGKSLDAANGELFGIRFAAENDSLAPTLGIYKDVTARSVTAENSGYSSLAQYNTTVVSYGVTPTIGDLVYNDSYFDQTKSTLNSIQNGTKIGDIALLSDVSALGLDFNFFGSKMGIYSFAFSFDAALLPTSPGIYLLGMECNNDIVAGYYDAPDATDVPTPAAILPTLFGLFGAASRKKKQAIKAIALELE